MHPRCFSPLLHICVKMKYTFIYGITYYLKTEMKQECNKYVYHSIPIKHAVAEALYKIVFVSIKITNYS